MKLESKAEESLSVEEEITILKHENFFKGGTQGQTKGNGIYIRKTNRKLIISSLRTDVIIVVYCTKLIWLITNFYSIKIQLYLRNMDRK
jgi:hypothetical protein